MIAPYFSAKFVLQWMNVSATMNNVISKQMTFIRTVLFISITVFLCSTGTNADSEPKDSAPRLTFLLPNTGYRGDRVSVIGKHLPTSGVKVFFGHQEAEIVSIGDNRYEVRVPFVENVGEMKVVVETGGKKTNALKYIAKDRPKLTISDAPVHLMVREEGTAQTYTVQAEGHWEIVRKSNGDWAEAAPASGQNNGSFHVTVKRNSATSPRTAEFAVMYDGKEAETIHVHQMAAKLEKAYMYAYGPHDQVGANLFGTIVSNFEKDYPGRNAHDGAIALQYPNGDLAAFNMNVSGHNNDGWSEYAVSKDGGRSWSMYNKFPYSYQAYQTNPNRPEMPERGLVTTNGTVILFISQFGNKDSGSPTYVGSGFMRSFDNGQTWTDYQPIDGGFVGTALGTASKGSTLYMLYHSHTGEGHVLYVSDDDGATWTKRSSLSLDRDAWYGTMCFMTDGRLIAGAYKTAHEDTFYYCISNDNGVTWGEQETVRLDKNIRNPKIACLGGKYYLFGRAGHMGGTYVHQFVVYQSDDGKTWSPGVLVNSNAEKTDGYSDVTIINKGDGPELMIAYSIAYERPVANGYVFFVKPVE